MRENTLLKYKTKVVADPRKSVANPVLKDKLIQEKITLNSSLLSTKARIKEIENLEKSILNGKN